ncbi:MAG: oligopeptide:H+ symporter, partial [Planctomycetales bacterium]|nr:oligopeptide:H+ symporter [Planctomycetales bacterium]
MHPVSAQSPAASEGPTLFGHPTGLFTLFFAEMWERFSYYGMRALLVFYMTKGFLGYNDKQAYSVYGAYTALVYMTPFFGGMLADRVLGARLAVILGGLLMAGGHLLMTIENQYFFFLALALLICGNGFFKPNISTIVGSLYPAGSSKQDAGFTIFYIGINLGAAMSPLLCGYIGETYGWHWGFGLATIGMLVGLAVFVMPTWATQGLIMGAATAAAVSLVFFRPDNIYAVLINIAIATALVTAGVIAFVALSRGGLPASAGQPREGQAGARMLGPVVIGTLIAIPILTCLVSGFSIFNDGKQVTLISDSVISNLQADDGADANPTMHALKGVAATVLEEVSKPAGLVLALTGILAFGYLIFETFRLELIARQRMYVVLILTFFSMLFWAFFEQAGSSVNNFTDRNVDRVFKSVPVEQSMVGTTIELQPTQEQLGYHHGETIFTLDELSKLRNEHGDEIGFTIPWQVTEEHVGMQIAQRNDELPASIFQAVNPVFILLLGLVFSTLWTLLAAKGLEPATPVKFSLGLIQLGLGFGAFWMGANAADERGMVAAGWLVLGYLLHTMGELCLSPVGLAM